MYFTLILVKEQIWAVFKVSDRCMNDDDDVYQLFLIFGARKQNVITFNILIVIKNVCICRVNTAL